MGGLIGTQYPATFATGEYMPLHEEDDKGLMSLEERMFFADSDVFLDMLEKAIKKEEDGHNSQQNLPHPTN